MATWNLQELMQEKNFEKEKDVLKKKAEHLVAYRNQYVPTISAELFKKILKEKEELSKQFSKISSYIHLILAKDVANTKAQAMELQMNQLGTEIGNQTLFLSLGFKEFDEANAQRIIKALPEHRHYLERARFFKKYWLTEEVEKVINIKDISGVQALNQVYDALTTEFLFDFQGKQIKQEQLMKYVRDPDPKIRKLAYNTLLIMYKKYRTPITLAYQNIVHDWKNEADLRTYTSPINVRNLSNDLEDEDVEILLKVFKKNLPIFQNYFKHKAKQLNHKLTRYDIYAPLKTTNEKYTYEEAQSLVLEAFKPFPEFEKNAALILKNHIDTEITQKKRSGAFCYAVTPDVLPYIMMSFTRDLKSLHTLAHELGHGIHDILSYKNSYFQTHPVLPLAESASTFAETLLIESLKKKNPELKKELTFEQMDDAYATIARQFQFVLFEKEAHDQIMQGKTSEEIDKLYLQQLKEHFGSSVEVPEIFQNERLYISHFFHTPFYCYAYGFGMLLAFSLYEQYQKNQRFKNEIITIFSSGSNDAPRNILKKAGLTMDEKFWQQGFDYLKSLTKDL